MIASKPLTKRELIRLCALLSRYVVGVRIRKSYRAADKVRAVIELLNNEMEEMGIKEK